MSACPGGAAAGSGAALARPCVVPGAGAAGACLWRTGAGCRRRGVPRAARPLGAAAFPAVCPVGRRTGGAVCAGVCVG